MSPALVILRHGPATERGWLGLRAALALGLGGHQVQVLLAGDAIGWALPLEARDWLGGDPGRDLAGLLEDGGAEVVVDAAALAGLGTTLRSVAGLVRPLDDAELARVYAEAELVVAF